MQRLDIAIAGAGPAGLAAALYLHRAGHKVTVFERFEQAAPLGSGLILQPTGLTVLADLGLYDNIAALGSRIDRLHGADATTGRTVLDVRYSAQAKGRHGIAVHRAALFDVLHEAVVADGIAVEPGRAAEAVMSGSPSVLVDSNGRSMGAFDLVVDATGSRSKLRRVLAGDAVEQKPLPYGAFWASLAWRGEGFDQHALVQRYRRASVMIGVLPIGRPRPGAAPMAAFFWSIKPEDVERLRQAGIEAWKDRVVSLWPECSAYVSQIDSFDDMTLARYGHHTLRLPVAQGFAVIGDAAHSTSPQLGQGANMALLDAAALAHALRHHADLATALDSYARSRRWHLRVFQALSYAFTPFYQSDSVALPLLRDRLVATVARIPPAPQFLASMVAGTVVDPFSPIGLKERDWRSDKFQEIPS